MKAPFRLLQILALLVCAAGFAADGAAPEPFAREARFSRALKPALVPQRSAVPGRQVPPVYPEKWKAWGQPAFAVVALLVNEYGNPQEIQCTKATDRAFARSAEKALAGWNFMPALKDQQAVCSKMFVRFEFKSPTAITARTHTSEPAPTVPEPAR